VIASENAAELTRRLEARRLDSKAAREGPDDPGLYFRTARLLSDRFEALPEALENYRTYIRVGQRDRTLIDAHLEAAQVLVRMDKSREAVLMLDRLLRQRYAGLEKSQVALKRAKLFELELADLEGASKAYQALVARYPKTAAAREAEQGLARIRGLQGGGDEAPSELSGDMPASLEAIRAEYLRGRRKKFAAAAEALRAALERSRDRGERAALALELARIENKQLKRRKSAAEAYEIYLEAGTPGRTHADAMLELAKLYQEELEKPAKALKLYDEFLKRYSSHRRRVPTMVERGKVLEALDRVQEALEVYRVVADSFPRSGHDEVALERLAYLKRTYFAAFNEAVADYRELIARFPFSRLADDAQYAVGRIYEIELGDLNQARIEYETLIQRYPTSEFLVKAQLGLTRIARR
jgi:tetratricopeptide (TPR) repeat protein